jgi:hypothetical protein
MPRAGLFSPIRSGSLPVGTCSGRSLRDYAEISKCLARKLGTGATSVATRFWLDEEGWKRSIAALDAQFTSLYEEQEDARHCSLLKGEKLIRADVFLIAFQSPGIWLLPTAGDLLLEYPRDPLHGFPERLAPILGDDVCLEIVSELNEREISVTQFHREFGRGVRPR